MLLKNKTAVIYGAAGYVGRTVAKAFANEGAKVFLTGHTPEKLNHVVEENTSNGGYAKLAKVDALNQEEVEQHLAAVIAAISGLTFRLI